MSVTTASIKLLKGKNKYATSVYYHIISIDTDTNLYGCLLTASKVVAFLIGASC